jgi:hypothetical protein
MEGPLDDRLRPNEELRHLINDDPFRRFCTTEPFMQQRRSWWLQFARSPEELAAFFCSASRHLGSGGRFISVVLNPLFSAYGQAFLVRRFTKLDGNKVLSHFLDRTSGAVEMAVEARQYTCEEYERAAVAGGMKPEVWKKLFATPDALQQMGVSFWQPCHEHQPFALFVAQKG